MIKFDWLGSKGSYLANNDNLGIVTGSLSFTRLEKGNCLILTSGNSITWTINSVDITNIISYIRGIGTYRVTLNANNTDVSLTNTIWNFQNSVVNALGITSVTVTATSGTVYLNRLVLLNGDYEVDNLETYFENSSPTEKDIRGFEYPKPTDLSNESGLVAAYSFSPETVSNGKLLDISGNGNHGTINGALLTKEGMKFDGTSSITTPSVTLGTVYTLAYRGKFTSTANQVLITDNSYYHRLTSNTAFTIYTGTSAINLTIPDIAGKEVDIVFVRNDTDIRVYVNGVLAITGTNPDNNSFKFNRLFGLPSSQRFDGTMIDDKIYNYAFTPQQAKDYHNSFIKPTLIDSMSDYAVGDTL
jgi:hypothetical protein